MKIEAAVSDYAAREAADKEYFNTPYPKKLELPEGVGELSGTRLLHIGDTFSRDYPYYKRLIDELKPDIILHTGDIADEVKVGRIEGVRYEYKSKISYILCVLAKSGARVIIVPGNNDVEEDIREIIPSAEIYANDTEIVIDGIACRIGHQAFNVSYDRQYAFFGHGSRGDDWDYEKNKKGGECRFNACEYSYLVSVGRGDFYRIPKPPKPDGK